MTFNNEQFDTEQVAKGVKKYAQEGGRRRRQEWIGEARQGFQGGLTFMESSCIEWLGHLAWAHGGQYNSRRGAKISRRHAQWLAGQALKKTCLVLSD
jgi:hypothetical protein